MIGSLIKWRETNHRILNWHRPFAISATNRSCHRLGPQSICGGDTYVDDCGVCDGFNADKDC